MLGCVRATIRNLTAEVTSECVPNKIDSIVTYEPVIEKTNNLGFRPDPTQIRLYSHRSRLEA